jgi:exonuclease SbcC
LHLSNIKLAAFRGVEKKLDLDFGKRLTIIYGGNATGKSSITQAIEFAISGQVRDYEDGIIATQYLANTRTTDAGRVSLALDDGTVLVAATNRPRNEIANRFRSVGEVDWPDRQPIPLTTTHVTTQGMLTRVLGSANAVTRNDLSGLCAGAYLRFLVSRAQKLADTFRQSSSGRNMQTDIRDARAAYDTAKLLHDSLVSTNQIAEISSDATDLKLTNLNAQLGLPESTPVTATLSHLERAIEDGEKQSRILQGLLNRSRELGQHEAESIALKRQIEQAKNLEKVLLEQREAAVSTLQRIAERLNEAANQRTRLLDSIATFEQYQQSMSLIAALEDRLREDTANQQRTRIGLQEATHTLDVARSDLLSHSTKLNQLRQARHLAEVQHRAIQKALLDVVALLPDQDLALQGRLDELRQTLDGLEQSLETVSLELDAAGQKETLIASRLREVSESSNRFLAASTELKTFVENGHCPLCGHDHGSREAIDRSIQEVAISLLRGSEDLRSEFETVSNIRHICEANHLKVSEDIRAVRTEISKIAQTLETNAEERRAATSKTEQNLKQVGLNLGLAVEPLRRSQIDIEARIAGLEQELRDAIVVEREHEVRLFELERAVATKSSEGEQLGRLAAELQDQITKLRVTLAESVPLGDLAKSRDDFSKLEPSISALQREQGQTQAGLTELERAIVGKNTEIAGAERRLQAVEGFLNSLDLELTKVGASRDPRTLLDLDQDTRRNQDELRALKGKASLIKQEQGILEESRALIKAKEQLGSAEQVLRSVQSRQQRLQKRSTQFKELHEKLQAQQNATAEIVLENVRGPVGVIFQAMTAGCPWDIEFKLEEGRVNAILADGDAGDIAATAVLNSAYVNVAAIALRLALASQQRWTRLRTVVLDDPILEMDHLTQSALIDGLEAILSSPFSPWENLQFVLTTWSEDFAVMAAHKLAHLNHSNGNEALMSESTENFIIHRLHSDIDGSIASQRHIPRWQGRLSAA